jgi:hypothetical protein
MKFAWEWDPKPNSFWNNLMRETGVEPVCPKAPDPKSSPGGEQEPNNGQPHCTELHAVAPTCAGYVTKSCTCGVPGDPVLLPGYLHAEWCPSRDAQPHRFGEAIP